MPAMVLFWSMLSNSSVEFCVVVSVVHTLIMLIAYAPLASFLAGLIIPVPWEAIALAVGIFLGLPLMLGVAMRYSVLRYKGAEWFESKLSPALRYMAMTGLLITLITLFALRGRTVIQHPLLTLQIATPLILEFYSVFALAYLISMRLKFPYKYAAVVGFDSASNHFEIAIAAATWGISSRQAFATVVGPLFEVPVMLSLAAICLKTRRLFIKCDPEVSSAS